MILFFCIMFGTFIELTIWFYAAMAAVSLVTIDVQQENR